MSINKRYVKKKLTTFIYNGVINYTSLNKEQSTPCSLKFMSVDCLLCILKVFFFMCLSCILYVPYL